MSLSEKSDYISIAKPIICALGLGFAFNSILNDHAPIPKTLQSSMQNTRAQYLATLTAKPDELICRDTSEASFILPQEPLPAGEEIAKN